MKLALNDYWTAVLRKDASRKITLQFLGYGVCAVGKIHPVWDTARYSHIDIQKVCVKAKMVTSRYRVAEVTARHRKSSLLCPLCQLETKDIQHFLLRCPVNSEESRPVVVGARVWCEIASDPDILTHFLLDCRHPTVGATFNPQTVQQIEQVTRLMCFSLHRVRVVYSV